MKKIVFALFLSLPSFSLATTTTTLTYQGFDGTGCTTAYSILVYIPAGAGPFPVHVHTVGSFAAYNGVEAPDMLANMSSRGYISASVEYLSGNGSGSYDCTSISNKTQCIYDTGSATSAISKICALPQADCSQGILVSGMSQGAQFATLANNYDAGVKAAYVISDGDTTYGIGATDFTGCVDAGHRTLPANLLRAVSGESDAVFGNSGATDASSIRTTLQNLTGLTCTPSSFSCFRTDGSGWYEIQDSETTGDNADHCYELGPSCLSSTTPDPKWAPPSTATWSMLPNLDWLSTYVPIHPATTFTATSTTITVGQSTTLTWTTSFANTVAIDQGIGSVATNSSVTVTPSATTTYTLTATGSGNGTMVKTVTITVNPASVGPSITTQPQNTSVSAGSPANFSVTASGTAPLSYQWQSEPSGGSFSDIAGATSAGYVTPALSTSDNGRQYQVIVTNSVGSVTSSPATVTVMATPVGPTIAAQPQGDNSPIAVGATATFSVDATGTAPLSYQWEVQHPGSSFTTIQGAIFASYTTPAVSASDNGNRYQVMVSNSIGSVTSSPVTLTVSGAPAVMTTAFRVYPNPWRISSKVPGVTFDGLTAGDTVKLFTLSGRWIKTLTVDGISVPWNLTNDSGDRVASGMYLYLITDTQGNKTKGKLTIIR